MSSADYVEKKKKLIENSFSNCVSTVLKLLRHNCNAKISLFEGPDDKLYYRHFFSPSIRETHQFVDCHGKENVLKTINALSNDQGFIDFKNGQLIAFVDRDFDNIPIKAINNVYKTPWYSIENFCCSKEAFSNFLKMELGLQKEIAEEKKKINQLTRKYYNVFLNDLKKLEILNSWGLYQRTKGLTHSKCHFNSICVDKICQQTNCWSYLETQFSDLPPISVKKRKELLKDSIHKKPVERYRGKWILCLYTKTMKKLIEDTNKNLNKDLINTKPRTNDVTLATLVNYAICPDSLLKFLEKYNWA